MVIVLLNSVFTFSYPMQPVKVAAQPQARGVPFVRDRKPAIGFLRVKSQFVIVRIIPHDYLDFPFV
jgi:hypothetical protein